MPKIRCQAMLEDLLYEAVDAGAENRDVHPGKIGHFVDVCVRPNAAGLSRRKRRVARRKGRR